MRQRRLGFPENRSLCALPTKSWRNNTMAENNSENWKDLCNAAVEAKDPDELLRIIARLCQALDREEQVRKQSPPAAPTNKKKMSNAASSQMK
jgi:hypothetical protein